MFKLYLSELNQRGADLRQRIVGARAWDEDRRALLLEAGSPDWFTLDGFQAAVRDLREEKKDQPKAQEILDQLESWVDETGIARL